jgi:membrane protein implicated in regulation of membrane protease activity
MSEHTNPEGVGADRLVGMTAIVTVPIDPDDVDRHGRVKVAGEEWGALVAGGPVLPAGSKVRVAAMAGTRVMVEPIVVTTSFDGSPPAGPPSAPPVSGPPPREEPS